MIRAAALVLPFALAGCVDLDRFAPRAVTHFSARTPLGHLAIDTADRSTYHAAPFLLVDLDDRPGLDLVYASNGDRSALHVRSGPDFEADESVPMNATLYRALGTGDLDGDGRPELIAPAIDAFRWSAAGLRALDAFVAPGTSSNPAIIADVDGDGALDVWMPADGATAVIYRWRWDGAHLIEQPALHAGGGSNASSLFFADIDGDGRGDVLLTGEPVGASTHLRAYLAGSTENTRLLDCDVDARAAAVVDVDGDGRLDLLVSTDRGISVCRGEDGTFGQAQVVVAMTGSATFSVADFDQDGRPDLVVSDYYNGATKIWRNTDGTRFESIEELTLPARQINLDLFLPATIAPVDLDRDGRIDICVWAADGLSVLYNQSQ